MTTIMFLASQQNMIVLWSGNRTKSCFSPAAQSDFNTLSSEGDDVLL